MARCPWCGSTDLSYRDDSVRWDDYDPLRGWIVTECCCFTKECPGESQGWTFEIPFTLDYIEE